MNKLMNFVFSEQGNVVVGLGVWATRLVEKKKLWVGMKMEENLCWRRLRRVWRMEEKLVSKWYTIR